MKCMVLGESQGIVLERGRTVGLPASSTLASLSLNRTCVLPGATPSKVLWQNRGGAVVNLVILPVS